MTTSPDKATVTLSTTGVDSFDDEIFGRLEFASIPYEVVSSRSISDVCGESAPWIESLVSPSIKPYLYFLLSHVSSQAPVRRLFVDLARITLLDVSGEKLRTSEAPRGWLSGPFPDNLKVLGIPDALYVKLPLDAALTRSEFRSVVVDERSLILPLSTFKGVVEDEVLTFCVNPTSRVAQLDTNVEEPFVRGTNRTLPNGLVVDRTVAHLGKTFLASLLSSDSRVDLREFEFETEFMRFLEGTESESQVLNRYWSARWENDPLLQEEFPFPQTRDQFKFVQFTRDASWKLRPNWLPRAKRFTLDFAFSRRDGTLRNDGLNVVGYFRSRSSLGDVSRAVSAHLRQIGVAVKEIDFPGPPFVGMEADDVAREVVFSSNLWTTSPSSLFSEIHSAPRLSEGTFNIGYPFWELELVPSNVRRSLSVLDEVWAPTEFVRGNFQASHPDVVEYAPFPWHKLPRDELTTRPNEVSATLDSGHPFKFGTVFDFLSGYERKNPEGAVLAFKKAFPTVADGGPELRIKSSNGNRRPEASARLRSLMDGRPDIIWVDDDWSELKMSRFFAEIDCYVSLHRAEGLNIPVSRSLRLHIPVICTNYGGVREMGNGEFYLGVSSQIGPVRDSSGAYPSAAVWAEPDIEDAAAKMRQIIRGDWRFPRRDWEAFVRRYDDLCDASWRAVTACLG